MPCVRLMRADDPAALEENVLAPCTHQATQWPQRTSLPYCVCTRRPSGHRECSRAAHAHSAGFQITETSTGTGDTGTGDTGTGEG